MTYRGVSGEWLSLLTQIAAFVISLALGLAGVRKGLTGLLVGIGIVADVLGQIVFAGGGPGACVGFVVFPILCVAIGHIGSGVRYLVTFARHPVARCQNCGTEVYEKAAAICPVCRRRIRCGHCGYSLTGNVSGVCPECGERIPPETHAAAPASSLRGKTGENGGH